jgi:hypothetical protein
MLHINYSFVIASLAGRERERKMHKLQESSFMSSGLRVENSRGEESTVQEKFIGPRAEKSNGKQEKT